MMGLPPQTPRRVATGGISAGGVIWKIFSQIVFGAGAGLVIATGAVFLLRRISFHNNGFDLLLFTFEEFDTVVQERKQIDFYEPYVFDVR